MKKVILFFLFLHYVNNSLSQENFFEATANFPSADYSLNILPSVLINPLFINQNLSVNTAPQNEPSVFISRVNSNNMVAAWRDFRLDYTTPVRRIGFTYSSNGGSSWSTSALLPDPNPGGHTSQSDPVVTADAQGNFYISSVSRRQEAYPQNRDVLIYKSTNSGQTWVEYSTAILSQGSGSGEDKEWMFCDPVASNSTYNNIFVTCTNLNNGFIHFVKSTNGGLNWTTPVNFTDAAAGTGSNICSGTNNQIYIVWYSSGIKFDKSTNAGVSFGTDFQLSNVASTNGFPFISVDYSNNPSRGNIYVVWDDSRNGTSDVWFQRSTNAGVSWLASPVLVNDVTTGSQYWPSIKCDINGYLYVIYYDTRNGASQINSYIAYSTNLGINWVNQQLSDSSFTNQSPNGDVRFGDYIGIDAYNSKVIPVWTDQRKGYPNQEIYTANLTGLIGINPVSNEIPKEFRVFQNYPNPFNPVTQIDYSVPKPAYISIIVYDVLGNEVKKLVNSNKPAGNYSVSFDASDLTSGIYFYKLNAENFSESKKMILLK